MSLWRMCPKHGLLCEALAGCRLCREEEKRLRRRK